MSDKNDTHYKSEQDDNGTVSKGSARTATAGKSSTSKSDASQKHISSGKKIKKAGVNLTPVESLLFFNIVRFNKDPGNVDWDQVAEHSSLKNANSAKVRFRQIQRKYGLEINPTGRQMKRKIRAVAATAEDEEPVDAYEDNDVSDNTPSKKRATRHGVHALSSQGLASQNEAIAQGDRNSEATALPRATASTLVADPIVPAQQIQDAQQVQANGGSFIKQESPVRQLQMDEVSPLHPNSSSPQQQRGHGQLSSPFNANTAYNMFPTQRSGGGMIQGMYPLQRTSNIYQSHGMTHQQLAHLQNLQQQHRERAYHTQWDGYPSPYSQNEPDVQAQGYMMQPANVQYSHHDVLPYYTQTSQVHFNAQGQARTQALTQAPTQASIQSPTISASDGNSAASVGDDFNTLATGPHFRSLLDEMVQMPGMDTNLTDTVAKPASQSDSDQGEEEIPADEDEAKVDKVDGVEGEKD